MKPSRRKFLQKSGAAAIGSFAVPSWTLATKVRDIYKDGNKRFDPWLEIDARALRFNVQQLYKLSGDKPVLAVVKNNAYGLGLESVAPMIDSMPEVAGFADVKTEACLKLRKIGVKKPILLMGMPEEGSVADLVRNNIQVAIYTNEILAELDSITTKLESPAGVHVYVDTGMSRMGVPYKKALAFFQEVNKSKRITINGSFMGFTEDPEFDRIQLDRFMNLAKEATLNKLKTGKLHAAASNAIFHFPEASLDLVRPGIGIYGAYPTHYEKEKAIAKLNVAYKLKCRVVRVEQLQPGDTVSYGRNYKAEKATWTATLPIGHADGFLRNAVNGVKVLINNNLYPIIGAVSASHAILEIGQESKVQIGDEAILVGPDHPEIHPNRISEITGDSVYDVLMHMSALLPKVVIG